MRSSASVRLPLVFSASTPSRSMVCARAQNVDARPLALLRSGAHLDHGGDIELLHQVLEADRRLRAHAGILRADEIFKPLRGGVVGGLLLPALLGGGRGRHFRLSSLVGGSASWRGARALASARSHERGPADGVAAGCRRGCGLARRSAWLSCSSSALILRRSMTSNLGVSLMIVM